MFDTTESQSHYCGQAFRPLTKPKLDATTGGGEAANRTLGELVARLKARKTSDQQSSVLYPLSTPHSPG